MYSGDEQADFVRKALVGPAKNEPVTVQKTPESELEECRRQVSELKAENAALRTENIQKKTENVQKTERISKLETELRHAKAALEAAEGRLKQVQGEADSLRKTCDANKTEISGLKAENAGKTKEIEGLKAENASKTKEIEGLKAKVASLNGEVKRLNALTLKLTEQVKSLEARGRELEENGKVLQGKLSAAGEQVKMLNKQIEDLKTVQRDLKGQISKGKADLAAEKSLLEEQNRVLRAELLDTMERCAALGERLKSLELSAAGILETLNPMYVGQREDDLDETVSLLTQAGMRLAQLSTRVCEIVQPKLAELKLSTVEEARWRVALDELQAQSRVFARLGTPAEPVERFKSCRIVETHDNPELVILNAGFRNGVRVNAVLYAKSGNETVSLRVIAVRAFISAAVPEDGDWKKLVPGVEVRTTSEPVNTEKKQ